MAEHNDFGKEAEEVAATYLTQLGYKILCRNYRSGKAEIDILASHIETHKLHIFEVKARSINSLLEPEESINQKKKKLLVKASDDFLTQYNLDLEVQFDVLALKKMNSKWSIKLISNAFYANEIS